MTPEPKTPDAATSEGPPGAGWEKQDEGELFKFQAHGDKITAFLTGKDEVEIEGKTVQRYRLHNDAGDFVILGTALMDQGMRNVARGMEVHIQYDGTRDTENGKMKIFTVYSRGRRAAMQQ